MPACSSEPCGPGLADCAPSGRVRLDAVARWLQDVAYADVEDAGLQDAAIWVVRRTRIRVAALPAVRRTSDRTNVLQRHRSDVGRAPHHDRTRRATRAADIEAVALWVHLDPVQRRPAPLTDAEIAAYGTTGRDRRVTARLRHPAAGEPEARSTWTFRATDCDLADHVNNAAYWQPLEAELLAGPEPSQIDVEIEFRTPSQPGEKQILTIGPRRWITNGNGEVHASVLIDAVSTDGTHRRLKGNSVDCRRESSRRARCPCAHVLTLIHQPCPAGPILGVHDHPQCQVYTRSRPPGNLSVSW